MKPVTADEMRRIDASAIHDYGIPSIVLMENAGLACVKEILKFPKIPLKKVLIFCGPGNNGGDGFVIARHLFNQGVRSTVFFFQKPADMKADPSINFKIISKMRLDLVDCSKTVKWGPIKRSLKSSTLIVDALFGSGLSRDIENPLRALIKKINLSRRPVVSVDIPSGLNADTGDVMGASIHANLTVTLAAPKKGFYLKKASLFTGKIKVVDISIPKGLLCQG